VTAWTGGNHTEENQYYWVDNDLHSLPDEHVDWFNKGLWCWREEEGDPKPRLSPADQSWYYTVPLFDLRNDKDVERLLIKPLVGLAIAQKLTEEIVKEAFKDAPQIMT
jgi:hypothetical protein